VGLFVVIELGGFVELLFLFLFWDLCCYCLVLFINVEFFVVFFEVVLE